MAKKKPVASIDLTKSYKPWELPRPWSFICVEDGDGQWRLSMGPYCETFRWDVLLVALAVLMVESADPGEQPDRAYSIGADWGHALALAASTLVRNRQNCDGEVCCTLATDEWWDSQ